MSAVMLVDDHQLLRQALRRALEDRGHHVVGEAGDGAAAVALVAEIAPDVIVMDVTMPVLDGIAATRRIVADRPEARVLVLTMHGEPNIVAEALDAGAVAFLTKDASMLDVVQTIEAVASGQVLLSPEIANRLLAEFEHRPDLTPSTDSPTVSAPIAASPLTKREEEILQLIADGASTTSTAAQLFISVKTVKNHLASIYEKLDARDRTQAVVSGLKLGIVVVR
jgi:DNA-binding NarL/FixJ family response regulator